MTIRVVCQACGAKLDIRAEHAGSKKRCPKCKTEFTVPVPGEEPAADSPDEDEEEELRIPVKTPAGVAEGKEIKASAPKAKPAAETALPPPPAKTAVPDEADDLDEEDDIAPSLVPSASSDSDDDDDDDYMPSFVTAQSEPPSESKTPAPPSKTSARKDQQDDAPAFSIPNLPPPTKPKFKMFDEDDFADDDEESPTTPVPAARQGGKKKSPIPDEFEDDFDEPPAKKSRGKDRGLNLPSPGDTGLSDPDSTPPASTRDRAAAARELRQALKDSTLRAPPEPTKERGGFNFDVSALMSEIGLKGLAIIVGGIVTIVIAYVASDRMMGNKLLLPKLGYVTGTVTYDGAPIANATVNLQPLEVMQQQSEKKKKQQIRTSFGVTDGQGKFTMTYMDGIEGVAVGKCRVWILLPPPLAVPDEYSTTSVTTREVTAGSQKMDFSLTSPPKR